MIKKIWNNRLILLSLGFLILVPLYPKIPLFDAIPGYLVRVRLEDFLIGLTGLIWLSEMRKNWWVLKTRPIALIAAYAFVGAFSLIFAIGVMQTIPFEALHIGKSALHYLRYLEYFSLFVFMFSSFDNKSHLKWVKWILAGVVVLVVVYGIGQKYLQWPLYSTMNREFSKGEALTLSPGARVQSTFAGHYDLSAYLVVILPILLSFALGAKSRKEQVVLHAVHGAGVWLLLSAASKIALFGYVVAAALVVLWQYRYFSKIWKKIAAIVSAVGVAGVATFFGLLLFAPGLIFSGFSLFQRIPVVGNATITQVVIGQITSLSQNMSGEDEFVPLDVTSDDHNFIKVATESATGEVTTITVEREADWSPNAQKYGLSMGIRLDALWPQAAKSFAHNLLTGRGYGTLNKQSHQQFTEADSTDNNYLRSLGETGVLGTVFFAALVILILKNSLSLRKNSSTTVRAFAIGMSAATAGLLLNAGIIDVFAASKVAMTYWLLAGIAMSLVYLEREKAEKEKDAHWLKTAHQILSKSWHVILVGVIFIWLSHANPFTDHNRITSFATDPNTTQTLELVQCWRGMGTTKTCSEPTSSALVISYAALAYPLISLFNQITMFYFLNTILMIIGGYFFVYLVRSEIKNRGVQLVVFLTATTNSYVYLLTASPTVENLGLFIYLGVLYIFTKTEQKHILTVLVLIGGLLISYFSGMYAISWIFSLLTILFTKRYWVISLPKNRRKYLNYFVVVAFGIFLTNSSALTTSSAQIIDNYQENTRYWRHWVVDQSNKFFASDNNTSQRDQKPLLVSGLSPEYTSLFFNEEYQPIQISHNATDQVAERLSDGKDVFLHDFDMDLQSQEYIDLRESYAWIQREFGCLEECNLYQLAYEHESYSEEPFVIHGSNQSIGSDNISITLFSNRYAAGESRFDYQTMHWYLNRLPLLAELNSDMYIALGDLVQDQDPGSAALLKKNLQLEELSEPITYLAGNYDQTEAKILTGTNQAFVLNSSLFILLNPDINGEVDTAQKIFLSNVLLQLEKRSDISSIVLITPRLVLPGSANSVVENISHQGNSEAAQYIASNTLPRLLQLKNRPIFIISGDLKTSDSHSLIWNRDATNNVTYVGVGMNNDLSDVHLNLVLTSSGIVSPSAFSSVTGEQIQLSDYSLEMWSEEFPQESVQIDSPNEVKIPWNLILSLTVTAGALILTRRDQRLER